MSSKSSWCSSKKISAQNDALKKEVDRLRHLQQLQSIPTPVAQSTRSSTNQKEPQRHPCCCFSCNEPDQRLSSTQGLEQWRCDLLLLLSWRARQALPIWGDENVPKRWGNPPDSGSRGIHLSRDSWQPFYWLGGTTQGQLSLPTTDVLSTIVKWSMLTDVGKLSSCSRFSDFVVGFTGVTYCDRQDSAINRKHSTSECCQSEFDAYLCITLGGSVCNCLLDTGSEISIFPERVVDPSLIKDTNKALKAANGTEIPILGQATLSFKVGKYISRRQDWSHLMCRNQCWVMDFSWTAKQSGISRSRKFILLVSLICCVSKVTAGLF